MQVFLFGSFFSSNQILPTIVVGLNMMIGFLSSDIDKNENIQINKNKI